MMEPLVDTVIEDPRWQAFDLPTVATRACTATLVHLTLPVQGFTLCLMGCDDAHIAGLNADFRGKPTPTNVLSWPSEERAAEYAGERPDLPDAGPADDPAPAGCWPGGPCAWPDRPVLGVRRGDSGLDESVD